jgi:hypothetical protein
MWHNDQEKDPERLVNFFHHTQEVQLRKRKPEIRHFTTQTSKKPSPQKMHFSMQTTMIETTDMQIQKNSVSAKSNGSVSAKSITSEEELSEETEYRKHISVELEAELKRHLQMAKDIEDETCEKCGHWLEGCNCNPYCKCDWGDCDCCRRCGDPELNCNCICKKCDDEDCDCSKDYTEHTYEE